MCRRKIDKLEVIDLAYEVLGEKYYNYNQSDIGEALQKEFGCDFNQFRNIVELLIPLTPVVVSHINNERFHAFVKNGNAIAKVKVKD